MSDPLRFFDGIAAQARHDAPPEVHVAARVLETLRVQEETVDRPLVYMSLASICSAAVILLAAVSLYDRATDPLLLLFDATTLLGI